MTGCFCTGECRITGVCPNQIHPNIWGEKWKSPGVSPLHRRKDDLPVIPPLPEPPIDGAVAICGECGIRLLSVMHYYCNHPRCPCFPRITC